MHKKDISPKKSLQKYFLSKGHSCFFKAFFYRNRRTPSKFLFFYTDIKLEGTCYFFKYFFFFKKLQRYPHKSFRKIKETRFERPKMGFSIPIGDWLLGPLREWAEELLSEQRIKKQGFLNGDVVKSYWIDHCSKKHDRTHELWNILMFQAWLQENEATLFQ